MESLKVKRALDLKELQELELSLDVVDVLKNYTIDSLILFTRRHELFDVLVKAHEEFFLDGSDEELAEKTMLFMRCEEEMVYALTTAGFFRHDFGKYHVSFNILAFLRILAEGRYDDSFFDQFENADREWRTFSNEEYESFEGLSNIQVYAFKAMLKEILSERQYKVMSLRMGFDNGLCASREEIADDFDISTIEVEDIEKTAFHLMRKIINAGVLKRMFNNYVEPEIKGLVEV